MRVGPDVHCVKRTAFVKDSSIVVDGGVRHTASVTQMRYGTNVEKTLR